jgi:hypothetical protein
MRNALAWLLSGSLLLTVLGASPAAVQGEQPKQVTEKKYTEVPARIANRPNEPKPGDKQFVEVKLWVVEVNLTKLRALGFDVDAIPTSSEATAKPRDWTSDRKFLESLQKNGLAQFISTPMIATRSGQVASLEMGRPLQIELTPTVLDGQQLELEYRIEVDTSTANEPARAKRRLVTAYSTELTSGETTCLSQTTSKRRNDQGKPIESKLVVLATATTVD